MCFRSFGLWLHPRQVGWLQYGFVHARHILGFKFMFYHKKDAVNDTQVDETVGVAETNERIPVPSSLYDVAAVLLSSGLVDLQKLLLVDIVLIFK